MIGFVKRLLGIRESLTPEDIYGTPVPWEELYQYRGRSLVPVYSGDPYPEKNATLRTLQDHFRAMNAARVLHETNPNAAGLVERVQDFAIGKGSSTEVQGTDGDEPPKRLSADVDRVVKAFKLANLWLTLEAEIVLRLFTDGEFFLRFFPDEDLVTKVRFVEPQQVVPPQGESYEGPWSFGIETHGGDVANPVNYCVRYGQEEEIVEACFMIHGKVNARLNQKRGIPIFYAVEDELRGSSKLRRATRAGEAARQSIAYFRKHESAQQGPIQALQDATARQVGSDEKGNPVYAEALRGGQRIDIPKGLTVEAPPVSPNANAASSAVQLDMEAVAARTGYPVWMVAGSTGDTNFAGAVVEESPIAKKLERLQGDLSSWVDAAQTKAVEIAIEQNQLPDDTLERVDLVVSFPSPVSRNKLQETQRRKMLHDDGVIGIKTWRGEEGYGEKEEQLVAEERAALTPDPESTPSPTLAAEYAREVK